MSVLTSAASLQLTERELGTVLASLRFWQRHLNAHRGVVPIAEHFDGTITALTIEEIDWLCERLNCGDAAT